MQSNHTPLSSSLSHSLSDALNPEINSPTLSININSPINTSTNTPRSSLTGFDSIESSTQQNINTSIQNKTSNLLESISVHAIQNASGAARNALISPLLTEDNKEHFAIILANCSKNIKYKASIKFSIPKAGLEIIIIVKKRQRQRDKNAKIQKLKDKKKKDKKLKDKQTKDKKLKN